MAAPSAIKHAPTLDEFLRMPGIDEEAPYLEYIDGRIEAKAMPTRKHGRIELAFTTRLNQFAVPLGLGVADPELRHTFAGRSIVTDVTFALAENVDNEIDGLPSNVVSVPPDIHIEVISPDQSISKTHEKILFSIANGCSLGIMVNPETMAIDVYRPNRTPERLADDGTIDFAPVLPGLVIPVAEVFGWMLVRLERPGADPA